MGSDLFNFESMFDETILGRGKAYWREGHVVSIEEIDAGSYCVTVEGSELYEVNVELENQRIIRDIECDCPYDWDAHCKHQAAVLFALRERVREGVGVLSETPPLMVRLKNVLTGKTKDALVDMLLTLVRENPALGNRLLYQADDKAGVRALVDAMWEAIRLSQRVGKRRGYACAEDVAGFMDDMLAATEEAESANDVVLLLLQIISGCEAMNDVTFDDDHDFSWRAEVAAGHFDELVMATVYDGTPLEQESLFAVAFSQMQALPFRSWDDRLVTYLTPLCVLPTCRAKVEAFWEKRLHQMEGASEHYMVERIKQQQFALLEQFGDKQSIEQFIQDNLYLRDFREKAIAMAMQKSDFQAALRLALDGARADEQSPGRLHQWQIYAFRAYTELGDTPKAQELAYQFLAGGDFDYYDWLKKSYSKEEWAGELDRLLAEMEAKLYGHRIYEQVLLAEQLWDRLMAHIEHMPSRVFSLYAHVANRYPERVDAAFYQEIIDMAQRSSDRSAYRELCARILTYGTVCGRASGERIVKQFREVYRRKPAMMDELRKAFPT